MHKTLPLRPALFLTLTAALSAASPAAAQAPTDSATDSSTVAIEAFELAEDDGWELETITIVGDRVQRARVAGSAQHIDAEQLERMESNDIHEVLATVPGVYVRSEDGYGLRPNIGLRGANSDRSAKVVLMEDGILLGPAPYSAPAAYFFPMMTRAVGVEVFKGPAAIRSGPNTIGGAINIQTRQPPRQTEAYLDIAGGSDWTGKIHAHAGTGGERWGVRLEGVRLQTKGFKELPSGDDTGFDKNELVLNARYNTDPSAPLYHQWDLRASYSNEVSHETYLGITRADFEQNPYQRYAASQLGRMKWHHTQVRASYLLEADRFKLRTTLYRRDFDRTWRHLNSFAQGDSFNDILNQPTGIRASMLAQLKGEDPITAMNDLRMGGNHRIFVSQGVNLEGTYRFDTGRLKHELRFGARLHYDRIRRRHTDTGYLMSDGVMSVNPSYPGRMGTQNTASTLALAAYLQDELQFKGLLVSPGLRVEHIMRDFEDELQNTQVDGSDTVLIPGVGVFYAVTPELGVLAGVHKGFSPVAPGQEKDVKPESSLNLEGGARLDLKRHGLSAELIGYFNDYSNLTGTCTMSSGCDPNKLNDQFNGGQAWVYGLEAGAKYSHPIYKQLSLRAELSYTLTLSEFRTDFRSGFGQWGDVKKGDELPYVPVHRGNASLGVFDRRWAVDVSLTAATYMRDTAGQGEVQLEDRTDSFAILDLSAHYDVLDYLQVYTTVKNALNTAYVASLRPFGPRPGTPLQAMLGLKMHL